MADLDLERERLRARATIDARPAAVFAVLVDPSRHAGIDGTGWVTDAIDRSRLAREGQVFRMAMYHRDAPNGAYRTANEVTAFEADRVIAWRTGEIDEDSGALTFAGWWWRYDLRPAGPGRTEVVHTYDWSAVGPGPRRYLDFPMFPPEQLDRSLAHLAGLVAG